MMEPLAVIFVLTLLGAAVLLLRKRGVPGRGAGSVRQLEAVERLRLGPSHTVHLIRVGDRCLLVATHAAGCTMLGDAGALQELPQ